MEDALDLASTFRVYKEYGKDLLHKKWWIVTFSVFCGLLLGTRSYFAKVEYVGRLTFMISDEDNNNGSSLAGVAGQFGINLGQAGGVNLDKVVQITRSQSLIEKALTDHKYGTDSIPLIMYVIELLELDQEWPEDLGTYKQFKQGSIDRPSPSARRVLNYIYNYIVGDEFKEGLLTTGYDDDSGIFTILVTTTNADISAWLAESAYAEVGTFYINQASSREKLTYEIFANKADSVLAQLESTEIALAAYQDRNRGLVGRQNQVKLGELNRKVTVLGVIYAETVKNRELAQYILSSTQPTFQIVDPPYLPIEPEPKNPILQAILGAIVGIILIVILIGAKTFFNNLQQSSK